MTDGFEILWLRHVAGPPDAYSLMRSRGGEPGIELYRSAEPFLFTRNDQDDIVLATTPRSADVRAQLVLLEKTGRMRIIAERPSAEAGVPLAVADRIGWSRGLLEHPTAVAGTDLRPTTVVELWHLFTGEHTTVDLGCTLNGATERHLVARCADRFIVRDLEQGLVGELPLLKPIAVVSKTAILRQAGLPDPDRGARAAGQPAARPLSGDAACGALVRQQSDRTGSGEGLGVLRRSQSVPRGQRAAARSGWERTRQPGDRDRPRRPG